MLYNKHQGMDFETFDSLSSLTSGKYDWKIKVRVARKWSSIQKISEVMKGYNMILVDDAHVRIHAFVAARFVDQFQDFFVEGEIYIISNFTVKPYKDEDKHRCFRDNHHIFLSNYTQVKRCADTDDLIPHEVFCFYDFDELNALAEQTEFLIDVVGVVERVEDVRNFENKNNQSQSYIKFTITNGSCDVKVTFWDSFGTVFDKAIKRNLEQPVIIIISSCKVNIWEGIVSLSNYPATRFFLNYKHHSVASMRKQLQDPSFIKRKEVIDQHSVALPRHTIKEIMEMNPGFIQKRVICEVKIKKVSVTRDWCFEICTGCVVELVEIDGIRKCPACGLKIFAPDKRFRIAVVASDENNSIQIVLADREVRRLIRKNVFQVELDECMEGDVGFPKVFKKLEDMECSVTLLLTDSDIVNRVTCFNAVDIFVGHREMDMCAKGESSSYIHHQESFTEPSVASEAETYRIEQFTPETTKSTNRKSYRGKNTSMKLETDNVPLSEWRK